MTQKELILTMKINNAIKDIHLKTLDGVEISRTTQPDGTVHCKNSYGEDKICKFDSFGRTIYQKDIYGNEEWMNYDKNGNCIYHKLMPSGLQSWREYNENGQCVKLTMSDGYKEWKEYDKFGRCIHIKNTYGTDLHFDKYVTRRSK